MLIKYGNIMSKQDAVRAHYEQRGYAASGDAYNRDMRKAEKADNATSYYSAPAHVDPEMAARVDKCIGCCDASDSEEEWENGHSGSCCVIL